MEAVMEQVQKGLAGQLVAETWAEAAAVPAEVDEMYL